MLVIEGVLVFGYWHTYSIQLHSNNKLTKRHYNTSVLLQLYLGIGEAQTTKITWHLQTKCSELGQTLHDVLWDLGNIVIVRSIIYLLQLPQNKTKPNEMVTKSDATTGKSNERNKV